MKNTFFIMLLIFGIIGTTHAQKTASSKQQFPIHISVLDESISLPNLWFLEYDYNPAIIIGTEYTLKSKEKSDFHLTGNIGYYYHKDWQSTFFILPEIGYRYHPKRWGFYTRVGLGYSHSFSPKPIYQYDVDNFKEVKDLGSPALMTSLSVNASYKLSDKDLSPELYASFMLSAELPFTIYTGIHQFVGIGYKFYPFKR